MPAATGEFVGADVFLVQAVGGSRRRCWRRMRNHSLDLELVPMSVQALCRGFAQGPGGLRGAFAGVCGSAGGPRARHSGGIGATCARGASVRSERLEENGPFFGSVFDAKNGAAKGEGALCTFAFCGSVFGVKNGPSFGVAAVWPVGLPAAIAWLLFFSSFFFAPLLLQRARESAPAPDYGCLRQKSYKNTENIAKSRQGKEPPARWRALAYRWPLKNPQ